METITTEKLEQIEKEIMNKRPYGTENRLLKECLKNYPLNNDLNIVAMKISLVDVTNSTHISQHKEKISLDELAKHIISIKDIDRRLELGDPTLVSEIASPNKEINLFSFATKYCCYHNGLVYEKDDYSIYDTILQKNLSKYFDDITANKISVWRTNKKYKEYNDYITNKLDELNINCEFRKRKFDHFIWYLNRKQSSINKEK